MARQTTPLTDKEIKATKAKEKTYRLFDGGGLYIEVTPKGQKWWRLKYRFNGKEKRISLGVYPTTSLQEARKQRELLKEQVSKGIDPLTERKTEKEAKQVENTKQERTLKAVAEAYFEHLLKKGELSDKYYQRLHNRIKNYVYTDKSAKTPVSEITQQDILRIIDKLADDDNREVARRVLLSLKNILNYAIKYGYIIYNVAITIKPSEHLGEKSKRHFPVITDKKELKELLLSIDEYRGDYSTKQALRMMPYVALRPANIRFLEWSEIDLDEKTITIPASKMKMNSEHSIPITPTVMNILEEMQPYSGDGKYIFPSRVHRDQQLSENTLNVGLRRLGYTREQIVSHSFRGMFSTLAHENTKEHGHSSLVIEEQLSHKDTNESRESYNHAKYFDERVELMEWWDSYLTGVKHGV